MALSWPSLKPRLSRAGVIALSLAALAGVMGLIALISGDEPVARRSASEKIQSIITNSDTRQPTIESLAAQLDKARAENEALAGKMDRMELTFADTLRAVEMRLREEINADRSRTDLERNRDLTALHQEFDTLQKRMGSTPPEARDKPAPQAPPAKKEPAPASAATPPDDRQSALPAAAEDAPELVRFPHLKGRDAGLWRKPAPPAAGPAKPSPGVAHASIATGTSRSGSIRVVSEPASEPLPPVDDTPRYRIPAGSILSGPLITGLLAPTSSQARREPHPVLVRLKHEAILPNRYHANVREAFVLLAAYGDLPAERAYMRAETISLVLNDGTVIQERLKAAAVGEDGMLGLGGKVITKQGAFIANALMVGFLQAAADVLKRGDTYELGLGIASGSGSGGGNPLSSIGLEGSSNALDRVAKWYVDQADNLFPVIEVQAGRPVDVVLTDELLIPLPQ